MVNQVPAGEVYERIAANVQTVVRGKADPTYRKYLQQFSVLNALQASC